MSAINVKVTGGRVVGDGLLEAATPIASQVLNGGSGSVATTIEAGNTNDIIAVEPDTACWITIAASPTASAGTTHYCAAGTVRYFTGHAAGSRIAAIDA